METKFICDHDSLTDRHGKFILEPLDKGAGVVIGNALRRVFLSQLTGAAVTAVKIEGVLHEFASIPGAVEDISEVIRNLKHLELKMSGSTPKTLRVSAGKGVITARELKTNGEVKILNPDAHIVTMADGARFTAEIEVGTGIGFRQAESGGREPGVIAVDADFCPVQRVAYAVKELDGDQESLSVKFHTNGSISPVETVQKAAEILKSGLAEAGLISSDFSGQAGTFVIGGKPGGHTIGSIIRWALMSYQSPDGKEHVTFADYSVQKDGSLTLEVQTDGELSPRDALSLAKKRLSEILDKLLSLPAKERGRPSDMVGFKNRQNNGSISFGDASQFWQAPNLLDIQRESYERFLQRNVPPQDRKRCGLEKALAETFPIENGGLTLECLGYSCGEPSHSSVECLEMSLAYELPITLRMRLTAGNDRVVEEDVSLSEIPLMAGDGTFIIKGLRRIVIAELTKLDEGDFNDLAKKRVRIAGDFFYEEAAEALSGLRTIASERMAVEDSAELTPSSLLCTAGREGSPRIEQVAVALTKFLNNNPYSQVAQDYNALASLTHCRRFKQDVGGVSIERVSAEQRALHHSTYGRMCSLETPEGPNVGLIASLAMHARMNDEGIITAPYRKVENGKASDQIVYLSAQEESDLTISQISSPLASKTVTARHNDDVRRVAPEEVDYVDAFGQQILGISASLIPLLGHDDPNRALMGSNMQRQAVPLLFTEQPLVQSGAEGKIALDSGEAVVAKRDGAVKRVTAEIIEITTDESGSDVYRLRKHRPAGSSGTWINQKPVVSVSQKVAKGQVIADGASSKNGSLVLGRNILVAYMPWDGYNYEDAILVSEKLIKEDALTSIHIHTYQAEIRDTRHGREMFSKQPPGVEESTLSHLDPDGTAKIGAWVREGDVLVGKMSPKAGELSPEDKLLNVLTKSGDKSSANYSDASLRMPPGTEGRVTKVLRLSRAKGDTLPKGVHEIVKVEVTTKRRAKVGDKLSGRHGNKGTISRILPEEDMPFMPDGTPVEMALNPLGVPTRMNLGQVLETHLGWAAKTLGVNVISPPYEGPTIPQIKALLKQAGLPESGMTRLCDGRTGRAVDSDVTVGYQYMMKLIHLVDYKIHARSTGPYSFFTQQPTGGKAHFGGQRFGEMETWALEAYGAAYTLRELLTVKSDDVAGRRKMYESLLKGSDDALTPFMPEAFKKLILCLRGAAFDMKPAKLSKPFQDFDGCVDDIDALSIALASPEKIRDEWSHGEIRVESTAWDNQNPAPDGLFSEKIFGENERMGHIELPAPVCHNWFLAAKPSPIATLLDMEIGDVRKVVYYKSYIVMDAGKTDLQNRQTLSADEYKTKKEAYGEAAFRAETGAGAIRELLSRVNLIKLAETLDDPEKKRMVEALHGSGIKPEWMILECLPVIPPDMRPSTYLEGGSVATLDLNELYSRIISRSNKYRELAAIGGQEIHEAARMIQESVDSLLGNGRRSKGETGTLKSLSDLLKGKEGMFRSNLLGKRVDYSGRSVIVVGPDLKLDECGLPESMALELFKPLVVHKLLDSGAAHSISSAHRLIDAQAAEAREAVRKVASERLIMLNRAPTLHRVGIQTFKPVLTDVSAIRLHPLVCVGFNADFDGDQMAVHIPLSSEAQAEARQLMLSQKNVLSAAHGGTIAQPSQDIIVGCYYLTKGDEANAKAHFTSVPAVKKAYELGRIGLHDNIQFRVNGETLNTTVGRVLFNEIVPSGLDRFINCRMDKRAIFQLVEECHARLGEDEAIRFLNALDDLGFKYATRSGISIGIDVLKFAPEKAQLLEEAETLDNGIRTKATEGEISPQEAVEQRGDVWQKATNKLMDATMAKLGSDSMNSFFMMVASGARGNLRQLRNVICLPGMVDNLAGRPFDTPVTSNYMNGLSCLEHFMMATGAKNGLIDVATRTGRAGHLMRKMVSASQDIVITEKDCGTSDGIVVTALTLDEEVARGLSARISGRVAAQDVAHPKTRAVIVSAGVVIADEAAKRIEEASIQSVRVRSPLTCKANYGICARCYGVDLSTGSITKIGDPVGVIAGTAVGEPATQLTFRSFAKPGADYVIAGMPRLDELLEAKESARILVNGSSMPLRDALSEKGVEVFGTLMVNELMRLYNRYGLNVNDKHFEIVLSRMLSRVRITDAGDTGFYMGEEVSISQFRLENQKMKDSGKQASAEPVIMGMHKAALSTDSFLAAAAFGDTLNVLTQAAIRSSRDELRGMRENLIVGKLIPAGTGFCQGC